VSGHNGGLQCIHISTCPAQVDTSTRGTQWGTGGMATKLTAARIATASGCRMVICSAAEPANIPRIIAGQRIGTVFHPVDVPLKSVSAATCWLMVLGACCVLQPAADRKAAPCCH
jgi:glutamate 5-kinase